MHNSNQTFPVKRIFVVLGALAALALGGCASPSVTNLTPSALAPNPAQTYKISARVKPSATNLIAGSQTVKIIIGGEAFVMTRVPNSDNLFEFDYKAPAGVTQFAYYFLVEYNVSDSGIVSARTDYSPLQHAVITDMGDAVATVTTSNTTIPWSRPADWDGNISDNAASAPSTTSSGAVTAGAFGSGPATNTVDATAVAAAAQTTAPVTADAFAPATTGNNLSITAPTSDIIVSPDNITVYSGSYIVVKFVTPHVVTGSPLLIDVTTDIPASVIMPEVHVKVGSNIASINLKGGKPGKGHLYVKAAGFAKTITVPITVK